jgi:hypothetical protein
MKKFLWIFLSFMLLMAYVTPASAEETGTTGTNELTQTTNEETGEILYSKTVNVNGTDITFSDTDPNSVLLDENSTVFQESLDNITESNQVEQTVATCKEEQAQLPKAMQDLSKCEPSYVVPDQYSSYRITNYYYDTFYSTVGWTFVKNSLIVSATAAAAYISTRIPDELKIYGYIGTMTALSATLIVNSYHPDYTKTYYIRSWSSYYNMYVYRLVTNVYSDSSRASWSLYNIKVSGPLKKVGSYFYAL